MARIAGIDLPKDKRIEIGLTYIYGIGRKTAKDIIAETGINPDTRVKDLTEAEENKLADQKRKVVRQLSPPPMSKVPPRASGTRAAAAKARPVSSVWQTSIFVAGGMWNMRGSFLSFLRQTM